MTTTKRQRRKVTGERIHNGGARPGSGPTVKVIVLSDDAAREARQKCLYLHKKADKATVSEYVSRLVLDADKDVYTAMLATVQADSE